MHILYKEIVKCEWPLMEVCNNFHLPARVIFHQKKGKRREYYSCCFSRDEKLQKSIDYLTNYILYYSTFISHICLLNRHTVQFSVWCWVWWYPWGKIGRVKCFKRLDANLIFFTYDSSYITYYLSIAVIQNNHFLLVNVQCISTMIAWY